MTTATFAVGDVIKRYRELTAEKAVVAQRHAEEMKPITDMIDVIEKWVLVKMQQDGVQNYKTDYGTAYQSHLTQVKMEDPIAFKNFVLAPAVEHILDIAINMGAKDIDKDRDIKAILDLIGVDGRWSLVNFQAGKKGILEFQEETNMPVPGVVLNQIININVRGT